MRCHIAVFVLAVSFLPVWASAPQAPEWVVSRWLNGDPGSVADQRGKVVLIHFLQLWCPGCSRFSRPLFDDRQARWGERDDVRIVAIHTVFEGHDYQTPERLAEYIDDHHAALPDPGDASDRHSRFSRFGSFDPGPVETMIEDLLVTPGQLTAPVAEE